MRASPPALMLQALRESARVPGRGVRARRWIAGLATVLALAAAGTGAEPSLRETQRLFRAGDYEAAHATAVAGRTGSPYAEEWWRLEVESLLALGKYADAHEAVGAGLDLLRGSLRLRLLGLETARFAGAEADAQRYLGELRELVVNRARYVRDPESLVAVGEAALLLGVEPRLVLENFFKRGREAEPPVRDAFLATGRLALAKNDDGLASRTFQQGIAAFPDDPEMWAGLAASFLDGDRTKLMEYAGHALELNPRHAAARLLVAEHLIDAEDYPSASVELGRVLEVNARHPEALALRAVLAELRHEPGGAAALRESALATWAKNPRVDHLIGRKLSQKYRFAEGAAYQRAALALESGFIPARMQLAQDLLRLGREDEGWALANEVHNADPYDVAAFNLATLHDRLDAFTVLSTPHFRLRMGTREASIYGRRALALLEEARADLFGRYGLVLDEPVTVEIYPDPRDFAVRTFGMPDNPGFLGVCFGPVVTINSPATRRANWEAVLWHEFAHVVTLTLTRNRMPRWLSEGISVFEETRRDPSWGQRMTLDYRARILGGRLQPISRMSAAFLQAGGGEDLQFAYFQAYLAVRFLLEEHGFEKLRALLAALGEGIEPNAALAAAVAPIGELDAAFARHAREAARALGPGLDLDPPGDPVGRALARLNPRSFHGRLEQARAAIDSREWAAAREHLVALTSTGLYVPEELNPHALLARVCRELGDREGEREALATIAANEASHLEAASRLLALAEETGDHDSAVRWAERWIAINPLAPSPWRALLDVREAAGEGAAAAAAGSTLLKLEPPDRPAIHYRVARALRETDLGAARRHVLLALEEAPRFRAAHQLLAGLPPAPGIEPPPAGLLAPEP